jgi:protoporphyrinogen oxidase
MVRKEHVKNDTSRTVILGGGLSGLSAGYVLTKAGRTAIVIERDHAVGGLSRTISKDGFRFDLGGHRFLSGEPTVDALLTELMNGELIPVSRSSKICLRGKYFDYPLRPLNAMFGMGIPVTMRILADYAKERIRQGVRQRPIVSLEDWVVSNFGRTMFSIYFKEYSEKIWGIDCSSISAEWVAERIKGLSLGTAIKNAFLRSSGPGVRTLRDRFLYPKSGIGRIADRLREEMEALNMVATDTSVERICHDGISVRCIEVMDQRGTRVVEGGTFISTIPVTQLIRKLDPPPPRSVLDAAARLRFRDLVVVAVMLDRDRATDQTWIYIPEKKIPFGRVHEPTNWSRDMAPPGKTLLVTEFFSSRGDDVWNASDTSLADSAIDGLVRLGFIRSQEVRDTSVIRVPNAYPLFEVGFRQLYEVLHAYLGGFTNLVSAGRSALFRYYNMDVAMKSGIDAAGRVMNGEVRTDHSILGS